jgi:hypothetical protein
MKMRRFQAVFLLILCAAIITVGFPSAARADMGPKPSVRIHFENMGDELCYGTLLSKTKTTGPASVWDGIEYHAKHNENKSYSYAAFDYETWKVFAEYQDEDGYYFLQEGWKVSETKKIEWTYYPPQSFKILLYYPETQTFAVSGIYERYAFDTYYTVDMDGVHINEVRCEEANGTPEGLEASRSYDYSQELISLAVRIVLTILIEMIIALLFGYRHKKQLLFLAGVNGGTQIVLNVLLNIINYKGGQLAFVLFYVLLEIAVFAIEAGIFYGRLGRMGNTSQPKWLAVLYAFIANAASFGVGIMAAQWLPGIF